MGKYVDTVISRYFNNDQKPIVTTFVIQQANTFDKVNIVLSEGATIKEMADKFRQAADAIEKAMND